MSGDSYEVLCLVLCVVLWRWCWCCGVLVAGLDLEPPGLDVGRDVGRDVETIARCVASRHVRSQGVPGDEGAGVQGAGSVSISPIVTPVRTEQHLCTIVCMHL